MDELYGRKIEAQLICEFMNKTIQQLKNDSFVKLMEYLDENEGITTAKGVEITGKSAAQVRRYLKILCELGILQSTKATKGNVFIKNDRIHD